MTLEESPEFRSFLRIILTSWLDLFVSDALLANWWDRLCRFELVDIKAGLSELADQDDSPPPIARVIKQIAMLEAKRRRDEHYKLEQAELAEDQAAAARAPQIAELAQDTLELNSGCPIRDHAHRRMTLLARTFRLEGMSHAQAQMRAFECYVEEVAREKSLAEKPCRSARAVR
jgi:hypothetical protein